MYSELNLATNRINHLLISMMKYRFPNIFANETLKHVSNLMGKTLDTWGNCK